MDEIILTFGPDNKYALSIPVTEDNRADLLQQLQAAVAKLKSPPAKKAKKYLPDQQVFSFCN